MEQKKSQKEVWRDPIIFYAKTKPDKKTKQSIDNDDTISDHGNRSKSTAVSSSAMATSSPGGSSSSKGGPARDVSLPMSRVKTIMKSSPDVETVSQESLFLITKATELFIMYLTKLAQRNGESAGEVRYSDLAAVVQRKDSMEFLHDIVPPKIKYKDYLALMANEKGDEVDLL